MRVQGYVVLFFVGTLLTLIVPNYAFAATIFFAQTDASVQSTLPPVNNGIGQIFVPAASGNAKTIVIRTTPGHNGAVDCSKTTNNNLLRLALWPANPTTSQPIRSGFAWFAASSTPPDGQGNCFYNFYRTNDFYHEPYNPTPSSGGTLIDGALVAGNTYIVEIDDQYLRWNHDIFGGSASGSGSGSLNGPGAFTPGHVGVGSYFMTISDTLSFIADHNVGTSGTTTPIVAPTITLLGNATTTAEFGATFTDPGATATDATDGDLTSAIRVLGGVDSSVMGTTTLSYVVTNSGGLSATTTRAVVVACTHDCYSNVLFLPGIEGSRLYEGAACAAGEEMLWEPVTSAWSALFGRGDPHVKKLLLDASGKSICSDVYAKIGDIIDSAGGYNIYKTYINEMNGLKTGGSIADWRPVSYDWRLSLTDLLNNGTERDGKIYYGEASSTPYIEQTLRSLAAASRTKKVTIVAHSNGGLVAKALLVKLGDSTAASLVDKVIMVGAPQSGAPQDLGALLVGHDAGIYKFGFPVVSAAVARELAMNSPMAYHLLPSQNYFDSAAGDTAHPVASFAGDGYAKEIAAYGVAIDGKTEMDNFILAAEGGRVKPAPSEIGSAEVGNTTLVDYANSQHAVLDPWSPPAGIEVDQIAGWGVDTIAGIEFYTPPPASALAALSPMRAYRPIFTEDGDGVVPVPSALMMATSTSVKRYWVNLFTYNRDSSTSRKHPDLFEIPTLEDFIKNLIKNNASLLPNYIVDSQPATITESKKLTFFLHSPLTLQITDSSGNVTGIAVDGSMTQEITNSAFGEFGDVKYVTVPEGGHYTLTMHGQATGTFSLDIQESSGGIVTTTSTIANVPTTSSTLASLTISGGPDTISALVVDKNGDGADIIRLVPKVGETVSYSAPRHTRWAPTPVASTPAVSESTATSTDTSVEGSVVESAETSGEQAITQESPPMATSSLPAIWPDIPARVVETPRRPIAVAIKKTRQSDRSGESTQKSRENINSSQTASVYDVSQQAGSSGLVAMLYNGLHGIWLALKGFFFPT